MSYRTRLEAEDKDHRSVQGNDDEEEVTKSKWRKQFLSRSTLEREKSKKPTDKNELSMRSPTSVRTTTYLFIEERLGTK